LEDCIYKSISFRTLKSICHYHEWRGDDDRCTVDDGWQDCKSKNCPYWKKMGSAHTKEAVEHVQGKKHYEN